MDENGQFVNAEFRCEKCGDLVEVNFHPDMLNNIRKIQQWLEKNAPCHCNWPPAV